MKIRITAMGIIICMIAAVLAGCGSDTKYLGKYYSEDDESVFIELKKENVFTVTRGDSVLEGTYEINGEDIILTLMGMRTWGKIYDDLIVDPNGTFWRRK